MELDLGYSSDELSLGYEDGEVFPLPPRTRYELVSLLAGWLKVHAPRDVLMPAPLGEKRPAHAHAAGRWTWARWDYMEWSVQRGRKDVGVLLRDLCIVDVDTAAAADALEAAYPELTEVPMERTAPAGVTTTWRGRRWRMRMATTMARRSARTAWTLRRVAGAAGPASSSPRPAP